MGPKFSFRARVMARFGRSIVIRHFTKLAYDQNDQIDLDKSTYDDKNARAVVWFPTKAGFPRGGGRPGMGALLRFTPEGVLLREDYAAWVNSDEVANEYDHIFVDEKPYRVFIRQKPVTDCGLDLLILREQVGGVS